MVKTYVDPGPRDEEMIVAKSGRVLPAHSGPDWWRSVRLQTEGPVIRHAALLPDPAAEETAKARVRREDSDCTAGLRSAATVVARSPELIHQTRAICDSLRRARAMNPALQSLHLAGGPSPVRPPPPERAIAAVRLQLARCLDGVLPEDAERRHPASPWRWALFAALAGHLGDSDTEVPRWLKDGAPMGLSQPILPGGHFPRLPGDAELGLDELVPLVGGDLNHPSFRAEFPGDAEAAGLSLVRESVAQGFAELYADRSAAAAALGGPVFPAPLGTVSKTKDDGSWKHRLIQDLRRNGVNTAVGLPERLVLPRPVDLAKDMAELASRRTTGGGQRIGIVDFADAFMSVPLAASERRFNCAELPVAIEARRAPLHPEEPPSGRMVVWRVLGFGGRPNPLVFGRITSVVMRLAQAVLTAFDDLPDSAGSRHLRSQPLELADCLEARCRAHLYVDDAAVVLEGLDEDIFESFDTFLLLLLALGAPIAWSKVALHAIAAGPVRWIGVDFSLVAGDVACLRLPPAFLDELAGQVEEIARAGGRVSDAEANKLVGRSARVAFVAPAAAPFAAALRTALADARDTACSRQRLRQRSSHAAVRFSTAASWFLALLRGLPIDGRADLPLERLIPPGGRPIMEPGFCDALVFDASPWGGGVVHFSGKRPVACQVLHWTEDLCAGLGVASGDSRYLPFFEALTALIGITCFCGPGRLQTLALVGDNLAALSVALARPGRGDLARACREIALRQARWSLRIAVGHLPSELNSWADALSRMHAPTPPPVPEELAVLRRIPQPQWQTLFTIDR